MTCQHIVHNTEGTGYCMLAEGSARKLIEIEKMINKWIPMLEKQSKESAFCYNLLEDVKQIKRSL